MGTPKDQPSNAWFNLTSEFRGEHFQMIFPQNQPNLHIWKILQISYFIEKTEYMVNISQSCRL